MQRSAEKFLIILLLGISFLGFALRATTQHVGKAGGLQIPRC